MQIVQSDIPPPDVSPVFHSFEPEAQPYAFSVTYEKKGLEKLKAWYWNQVESSIPTKFGGKGKKALKPPFTRARVYTHAGGELRFYQPLLQDLLLSGLSQASFPEEVIFTTEFGHSDTDTHVTLSCRAFLLPRAVFPMGIHGLQVEANPLDMSQAAVVADAQLERMRAIHSNEHEKVHPLGADALAEEGDMVVVTIRPTIEGVLWTKGAITNGKILLKKGLVHPDTLREALIGKGRGNFHTKFTLTQHAGPELVGVEVEADITVHSVLTYVLPEWSDELAVKMGGQDLESLRQETAAGIEAQHISSWQNHVGMLAVQQLMHRAKFAQLPAGWVTQKIAATIQQQLTRFKGDKRQLMDSMGLRTEVDLHQKMASQVQLECLNISALLGYGSAAKIEREKTDVLNVYLQKILAHLVQNVTLVEPKPQADPQIIQKQLEALPQAPTTQLYSDDGAGPSTERPTSDGETVSA